ncbi:MAG: YoaK family protein, partial [Giesbergeria sp.]
MSAAQIRTTHMTGTITDLGIELGKLLYWNHSSDRPEQRVRANRQRLGLFAGLTAMFLVGGIAGAAGFKHVGFIFVVPLALVLCALALPPLWIDRARFWPRTRPAVVAPEVGTAPPVPDAHPHP